MKKALLLIVPLIAMFLFSTQEANASHIAGGEIWYEHQPIAGQPMRYKVFLILYKDANGAATLPSSAMLCYTSTCHVGGQVTLPGMFAGGPQPVPSLDECANDVNDLNWVPIVYQRYEGFVNLPGKCSDWQFFWTSCCRNYAITNLQNPGSQGFVIEAKLNNMQGENDSPEFVSPAAKAFCVGSPGQKPFVWPQFAIENDGDSIRYTFGQPLDYGGTCTSPSWSPIPFLAGHTKNQPMQTFNGITVDERLGTFTFLPSTSQVVVMKVDVEEYRYDSIFNVWRFTGSSTREIQVPVLANCKAGSQGGPKVDIQQTGQFLASISSDSLQKLGDFLNLKLSNSDSSFNTSTGQYDFKIPVVEYPCYSSAVNVKFQPDIKVMCKSIAPDGSDFRIIGPDSVPRPVVGVNTNCQGLSTNEIDLLLHKPLDVNGLYYLYVKPGNDGNTLENVCGFELDKYFLIILQVTDCPQLDYRLENVSVQGDSVVRVDWFADPSSFSPDLFTEWRILRSNNGSQFYPLESVDDVNARSFIDETMAPEDLDAMRFQYAIQLRQNFDFRAPTNIISSILLKDSVLSDSSGLGLEWSEYDGWTNNDPLQADRQYQVFIGKYDTATMTEPAWVSYEGPMENFFNTTYGFPSEQMILDTDTAGMYAVKVEATPVANQANNYLSESNWIYFELGYEEPEDPNQPDEPLVPNVFTPNGDHQNDRFFVKQANGFMGSGDQFAVAIYNRWGKPVFEDTDYRADNNNTNGWDGTDMNTNSKVADGVYYYVINLRDSETGITKELTGQISIFSLGL